MHRRASMLVHERDFRVQQRARAPGLGSRRSAVGRGGRRKTLGLVPNPFFIFSSGSRRARGHVECRRPVVPEPAGEARHRPEVPLVHVDAPRAQRNLP